MSDNKWNNYNKMYSEKNSCDLNEAIQTNIQIQNIMGHNFYIKILENKLPIPWHIEMLELLKISPPNMIDKPNRWTDPYMAKSWQDYINDPYGIYI